MEEDVTEVDTPMKADTSSLVTTDQLTQLADKMADHWESFALSHLGIEPDDVEYIKTDKDTPLLRAKHSLTLWKVHPYELY